VAENPAKRFTAKAVASRQQWLTELCQAAIAASPADQTEIRVFETDAAVTRFAGSQIHQNTFESSAEVTVTARMGQREGRATTNLLSTDGLARAAQQATAAAEASPVNALLADLPSGPQEYPFQTDFYEGTALCSPEERASLAIRGFKVAEDTAFTAAGTLSTETQTLAVVNSRGIAACFSTALARYNVLWTGPDSTGWAEGTDRDVNKLDPQATAVAALATARRSTNPRRDVAAGSYTVILGPQCSATLLGWLALVALSGKAYADGVSALSGMLGRGVCGSSITLIDDPLNPQLLAWPCDLAGLPKQRLGMIESGVARAVAHDAQTAKRSGMADTAHNGIGVPSPSSLVLSPGGDSLEQLIRETERGLYVSRFHYVRNVDSRATLLTGMTRDGTFLIENGQLGRAVTNFRFNQGILPALNNVTGISSDSVRVSSPYGLHYMVPEALRVEDFAFSSKSDH
jgi:PmbA protein